MTSWNIPQEELMKLTVEQSIMLQSMIRQLNQAYDECALGLDGSQCYALLNAFKKLVSCWECEKAMSAHYVLEKWEDEQLLYYGEVE